MTIFPKFEEIQDITEQELINWLGSDYTRKDLIHLLLEIANGFYEPHYFFNDIRDYTKENTK